MFQTILVIFLKLVLSALIGAFIGMERQTHGRPAGLRTHTLVCLGSTLFTICSYAIAGQESDPGRVAAQIVAGIGFLGAGTIMRQGSIVIGLTSAASIWATAGIGMAIGVGGSMSLIAGIAGLLVYSVLHYLPMVERFFLVETTESLLVLTVIPEQENVLKVTDLIYGFEESARLVGIDKSNPEHVRISFKLELDRSHREKMLIDKLNNCENLISFLLE